MRENRLVKGEIIKYDNKGGRCDVERVVEVECVDKMEKKWKGKKREVWEKRLGRYKTPTKQRKRNKRNKKIGEWDKEE